MELQSFEFTRPTTQLHVVEIVGGGIEIGSSSDPAHQIAQLQRDARANGRELGRFWISAPHWNAEENETYLSQMIGREQLGKSFKNVVDCALNLDYHDDPKVDENSEKIDELIHSLQADQAIYDRKVIAEIATSLCRSGLMAPAKTGANS